MKYHPDALYSCVDSDLKRVKGYEELKHLRHLPPDCGPRLAAAFSIRDSFFKKLKVENTIKADNVCLLKFLDTNKKCESWVDTLPNSKVEVLAGIFKENLDRFFDPEFFPDDFVQYMNKGRTGPGVTYSSQSTDLYSKLYSSTLTCKSDAMYDVYSRSIALQPLAVAAELLRSTSHGPVQYTVANRLSFVPKYTSVSRSICIEPTLNMIYQLGVSSYIERRLNSFFGIDIRYQPEKNRVLCRKGSRSGLYSTLDLSSASDSISLKMLHRYLPRYFFNVLKFGRSEVADVPAYGLRIPLYMVSTMGNGYTFSLQTAIFAAAVLACYRFRSIKPVFPRNREYGNFSVFGDDIIVVPAVYDDLVQLLSYLGFEVNVDKSFNEGPFRESCGVDCYHGVNIRGVYVKSIRTAQDCISVINEINLFSMRTGVFLPGTVQFLLRLIKIFRGRVLFVPMDAPSFAGIRSPLSAYSPRLDPNGSYVYKAYEPIKVGYRVFDDKVKFVSYHARNSFSFNPFGFELAFLAGAIKDGFCSVRHNRVQYSIRDKVTPSWDDSSIHSSEWFDWRRFGTAFYVNMFNIL